MDEIGRLEISGLVRGLVPTTLIAHFPPFLLSRANAFCVLLLLVLLAVGCCRDVIEALAEGVWAYCQHLPPEERTFYVLAAGHSKVGTYQGLAVAVSFARFRFF